MTAAAERARASYDARRAGTSPLRVALVGNPNAGKSTLFNALTGRRQRVANFPGVTVEHAEGTYEHDAAAVTVIDLPGTYSVSPQSPDEAIALDVLLGRAAGVPAADVIVVVVDAVNLERNLFFASQILELGRPTVIALNRMDRVSAEGTRIDVPELIHELGAVVVPVTATRGEGVERLRHAIALARSLPLPERRIGLGDELDVERRYAWIAGVAERCVVRRAGSPRTLSDRVDAVLLHRVWGLLVFLAVLLVVFQAMFTGARPLADGIQWLVDRAADGVGAALPPGDLRSLITDGALGGVGSVLVFLPQIAILFLFIGVLEDSGYMARAAFVMDRYMRPLGLQGRSFIPLVSGYACAVPGIMATRTIQQREERLATIMVVPLMSCSARLPVYTLLIAAFVPPITVGMFGLQSITMLGMYLLGTGAALAVAAIFRRTLLRSDTRALIMELPRYSVPSPRVLLASVWQRVRLFLRRAGTVIFAISILLWGLSHYPRAHSATPVTAEQQLSQSALGRIGHAIEPAVHPLGYDWKIGVSMIASFAAREVFVSTMGTIYSASSDGAGAPALSQRLRAERDVRTGAHTYTPLVAIGLMVFYVFALMCTSTVAITVRETGGRWMGAKWAALQFGYMLALAYGTALIVYRAGLALGLGAGS